MAAFSGRPVEHDFEECYRGSGCCFERRIFVECYIAGNIWKFDLDDQVKQTPTFAYIETFLLKFATATSMH